MSIERTFIKEGIRISQVESFLRERFKRAGYSHAEIQRTPVGTRIIVYANRPGLVIGQSGRRVNEITEEVKTKFGFENPLIDVHEVREPMLDANIVAERIASDLERGLNYKRVCNFYLEKVLGAGAAGIQIIVKGKIASVDRSRYQKFRKGFVAHSGDYAEKLVDKAYARAMNRAGAIGIQVRIMKQMPVEVEMRPEEAVDAEEKLGEKVEGTAEAAAKQEEEKKVEKPKRKRRKKTEKAAEKPEEKVEEAKS